MQDVPEPEFVSDSRPACQSDGNGSIYPGAGDKDVG
jgi:hypothetical protein